MPFTSPPPARAGARAPVRYSAELGRAICARLAAGASEAALCREAGMPSVQAVRLWARREPEFGAAYEAAKDQARSQRLSAERRADISRRWRQALARAASGERRGGRSSAYRDELGEAICARIAGGESVLSIGADPDMPCAPTIYHWARGNMVFREAYLAAKDIAADLMFDLAMDIALEATAETVRADDLRIRTLRWRSALTAPKKYGLRRALGPAPDDGDGEGGGTIMNVIIRNFGDPEPGAPQFVNLAGEEVPRPAHA
ncbi:hypothetical protein [Phenylobacterium sp.]|uniref:terminase small subunit-like protein n=1 Tax=Phenylobacterium sp. TaxID=1871053 RepID=UPI0027337159|nr:hypothetical protein [Phenylobacterium sp.]MDP3854078.1 hypothetical protein [Phenylobacterium sp.]